MPITFPIDAPLKDITTVRITEHNANTFIASDFTGSGVVQEFEGEYWTATLRYRNLSRLIGQPVMAFGSALRGAKGTFVLPFPGYSAPLGAAKDTPSSPSVDGSGQAGKETVLIKSAPVSIEGWLRAGDIIQIGPASRPHWHKVLEDVDTDASGEASIDIWPRVREGVVDNDLVSYSSPLCLFRLVNKVDLDLTDPVRHSIDFDCREAI